MRTVLVILVGIVGLLTGLFIGERISSVPSQSPHQAPSSEQKETVVIKEPSLSDVFDKKFALPSLTWHKITGQKRYSLDCQSRYYTDITVGGGQDSPIPESSLKLATGHEQFTLGVAGDSVTMFGADFDVIQDDELHLVALRSYGASGLTETLNLNKESGILLDAKTLGTGLSFQPTNSTYLFECEQN